MAKWKVMLPVALLLTGVLVFAVALALTLTEDNERTSGAGGPASTAPRPAGSPREMATMLAKAGLGCNDLTTKAPSPGEIGPKAVESGTCQVGVGKLDVSAYASPLDAEAAFTIGQSLACSMVPDQANGRSVVMAGTQMIGVNNGGGDLTAVAAAVGGTVRAFRC